MKRKGKLLNRVCFILAIVNMFLISLLMFRIVSFFIANGISMLDKAINSRNYSINKNEAIEIYSNTDEKQVQSMNNENEKNHINQNPEIDMKNASKEEIQQWKLNYILTHSELYTSDLQELVQKNSETIDYVYGYPNYVANLNQERSFITNENDIDLTKEVREDTIPLLLQWDTRWGYISYGTGMIGYTGCAPTCLSMVALYLTKNPIYTPIYIAERAENQGYYCDGVGTSWKFMDTGCKQFGIKAKELPLHENSMKKALEAGKPIICAMRQGDFTTDGHYIVLTGYENGKFSVNDPNSKERSSRLWSFEELKGQIKNLWSYKCR